MTGEEKVIAGLNFPGEAHEADGISGQGRGHGPGNQLGILAHIRQRRERQAPVGDRTPEMCAEKVLPSRRALQPIHERRHLD